MLWGLCVSTALHPSPPYTYPTPKPLKHLITPQANILSKMPEV